MLKNNIDLKQWGILAYCVGLILGLNKPYNNSQVLQTDYKNVVMDYYRFDLPKS